MRRLIISTLVVFFTNACVAQAWPKIPSPFEWQGPLPKVMPLDVWQRPCNPKVDCNLGETWPGGPYGGGGSNIVPGNPRPYQITVDYDRVAHTVGLTCRGHAHAIISLRAGDNLIVITRPHPYAKHAHINCKFDGKRRVELSGVKRDPKMDVEANALIVGEYAS